MNINGKDIIKKIESRGKLQSFNQALKLSGLKLLNVLPLGLSETDKKDMAKAMIYLTIKAYNEAPELKKCSPDSIIGALMECATLGMMPFSMMNECAIIPYGGKAQTQLMYRGILKLCRNTGEYKNIRTGVVREGDIFNYVKGLKQDLVHLESNKPAHKRNITHVYALYELMNGGTDFEVMTMEDLENHRDKYSKQYKTAKKYKKESTAIWIKEFEAMARKTILIKLMKYAPKSDKLVKQLAIDREIKREIAPETKDFTKEKEAEFVKQRIADTTGVYDTEAKLEEKLEEKKEKKEVKRKSKAEPESEAEPEILVTEKQIKRYYALLKEAGIDPQKADERIKEKYKIEHKKDLTMDQIDEIFKGLEKRIKEIKEEKAEKGIIKPTESDLGMMFVKRKGAGYTKEEFDKYLLHYYEAKTPWQLTKKQYDEIIKHLDKQIDESIEEAGKIGT